MFDSKKYFKNSKNPKNFEGWVQKEKKD